jgi:hypothetical protein
MAAILDVSAIDARPAKLAEHIVVLIICAERGTIGRIPKPFFAQLLAAHHQIADGEAASVVRKKKSNGSGAAEG